MKICLFNNNFHVKNRNFIYYFIKKYHTPVNNIEDADIIYSPDTYIDIHLYPNKKFIFGPHFSVFPNHKVQRFNNIHKNGIYIQPSQPSVDTWQKEFKFTKLPMKAIPFGVDTDRFVGNKIKTNIVVYYKHRDPYEFKKLLEFLNKKQLKYKIFSYKKKYQEQDFLNYLKTCKYGIVLDAHESQGFAIQEMLSCNIPLLVWGSKLRKQEYPHNPAYEQVKSEISTVPYWSEDCGELFHEFSEIENKFETFIQKIDSYKPRDFILNNLSMEKCCEKWNNLLSNL